MQLCMDASFLSSQFAELAGILIVFLVFQVHSKKNFCSILVSIIKAVVFAISFLEKPR